MNTIYNGRVKWFNMALGYGWIIEAESQKEYFCHHSGLNDHIRAGDKVQFNLIDTNKGKTTINVIKCW
jgi:cold shock protein